MKFTLIYDGDLPSTGNRSKKIDKKWEIRKTFHPQLADLYRHHPVLLEMAENGFKVPRRGTFIMETRHPLSEDDPHDRHRASSEQDDWIDLLPPKIVCGKKFLPLVRRSMLTCCGLKILFLRREEPGSLILQGGDIDNRLKTLFDALKVPDRDDFVDDPTMEEPLHCLLESDALITGIDVRTDRLLAWPNSSIHQARLVIEVDIRVTHAELYNMQFLGD